MSRYIDLEELEKRINDNIKPDTLEEKALIEWCKDECIRQAYAMPRGDVVEVVHAYWKETKHITESKRGREIHSKLYNCSNCDAPNGRKKSSYCHWCGAKMDGERRESKEK